MTKNASAQRRAEYFDFDVRPAHIYAEAAAQVRQKKIQALQTAMHSLLWKPPRRRD